MLERLLKDYDKTLSHDGVDGERLAARLAALAEIGAVEGGGVSRIAFSDEEQEAKELVMQWMEIAGLAVHQDGIGNVIGTLAGTTSDRVVMSGSHLDSVPHGGHFDGPLGVLAALEVAEAWKDTGFTPEKTYEVVVFTDEEGARFHSGMTGSQAMTGDWNRPEKERLTDIYGETFAEVLRQRGLSFDSMASAARDLSQLDAFIEVHIEQGKRLEKEDLPVGIVEGIAGPSWLEVTFTGEAGHAGNTPMPDRRDALAAAGQFVSTVPQLPEQINKTSVATVGRLHVKPNGVNVIPGEVTLTVDIRDIQADARSRLQGAVELLAEKTGAAAGVDVSTKPLMAIDPIQVEDFMKNEAAATMRSVTGRTYFLPSGAGHDAMILGRHLPMGMLFTRSKDGVSHNPAEWSSLHDCVQTVHVLKAWLEARTSVSG
ncbi:Zn-dependent hydrolase [Alkalicoccus chagannorensis]|uniref:Zn-dependent hydrolase n=1 Tax=Alkalicoccus chagannorensis TaxID=427072 RepID=UPI000429043E|nr:Zn-dependent hydrolase [Alkalicoccus chagannorensis]